MMRRPFQCISLNHIPVISGANICLQPTLLLASTYHTSNMMYTLEFPTGSLKAVFTMSTGFVVHLQPAERMTFPSSEENNLGVKQQWRSVGQKNSPSPEETLAQAALLCRMRSVGGPHGLMSHFEADLRISLWLQGWEKWRWCDLTP